MVIWRRSNFVYHHWGNISIYRPLSYPFRSLWTYPNYSVVQLVFNSCYDSCGLNYHYFNYFLSSMKRFDAALLSTIQQRNYLCFRAMWLFEIISIKYLNSIKKVKMEKYHDKEKRGGRRRRVLKPRCSEYRWAWLVLLWLMLAAAGWIIIQTEHMSQISAVSYCCMLLQSI